MENLSADAAAVVAKTSTFWATNKKKILMGAGIAVAAVAIFMIVKKMRKKS